MTTQDFIIALFCQVDDQMTDVPKHPDAKLSPSEVVTLALLFAIKGVGGRAFYRWLKGDYAAWFPQMPERTRLLRLFKTHTPWMARFLAAPTCWGWPTAMGLSWCIPCGKAGALIRLGKRARAIIAGLSAGSSPLS